MSAPARATTTAPTTDGGGWADPTALGNLTIGVLIFALVPGMFGLVEPVAAIAAVPWILTALPVLLLVVVLQFRRGDVVGATANGLLGVVLMGQNGVKGVLTLGFLLTGTSPPEDAVEGGYLIDGFAYAVAGVILMVLGALARRASAWTAIAVVSAALGFVLVALASFGAGGGVGRVGAVGLVVIAAWLVYSGLALLVNGANGREVLPTGSPVRSRRPVAP